jgi:hypothetical protein
MQFVSTLHETAYRYAESGIPVFVCIPNSKLPATPNGFKDATTDIEQINRWYSECFNYNIGMSPADAGWAVVDVEYNGLDDWRTLANAHPEIETYSVKTPRGGRHLYFEGSLPSRVRPLKGMEIDTRGSGGYVLLPPSIVDGKAYEVETDTDIARLPGWLSTRLDKIHHPVGASFTEEDDPGNIDRGRNYLSNLVGQGDVAIQGRGGNDRTYRCAADLLDLGISPASSLALIADYWNPHCIPPWSADELQVIFEHVEEYRQNKEPVNAVAPASDVFADAVAKLPIEPVKRSRFHPQDDDEMDLEPQPRWQVPQVIQERSTVMIYGPTQSYKSFLAVDLALGIATGKETFGVAPGVTGPVFYGALEGKSDIMRRRRPAWRLARGVTGKTQFYVMPAPMLIFPEEVEEFKAQIRKKCGKKKPALIVLDTVSKVMVGMDATKDASKLVRFCDALVEEFECSVIAVHHSGHDVAKGPRDSSAYHAGFDTVIEITSPTKRIAVARVLKHKDAEEPEHPFTFEGKIVGNSLVFQPTTFEEHKTLTKSEDPLEPKKVGGTLKRLHAVGEPNAVTTHVLADELVPRVDNEDPETRKILVSKMERLLRRGSGAKLEAYTSGKGKTLLWHLPGADE